MPGLGGQALLSRQLGLYFSIFLLIWEVYVWATLQAKGCSPFLEAEDWSSSLSCRFVRGLMEICSLNQHEIYIHSISWDTSWCTNSCNSNRVNNRECVDHKVSGVFCVQNRKVLNEWRWLSLHDREHVYLSLTPRLHLVLKCDPYLDKFIQMSVYCLDCIYSFLRSERNAGQTVSKCGQPDPLTWSGCFLCVCAFNYMRFSLYG